MAEDDYWTVEATAYPFKTQGAAYSFADKLHDAFARTPGAEGRGFSTRTVLSEDAPTPSELATLRRLRAGELVAVEAAENKRLRDAANHCRLAFAGYVSVRSAIDKIDALGSLHAPLAAKEEGNG